MLTMPYITTLDNQQNNSTSKYETPSSSRVVFSLFLLYSVRTVLYCSCHSLQPKGQMSESYKTSLDIVSLRRRGNKVRGRRLSVELCVYMRQCHKLACSLVWFSDSISHRPNRLTIVKMVSSFLLWVPKGRLFWRGKQLNLYQRTVIRLAWDWNFVFCSKGMWGMGWNMWHWYI